MNEKTEAEWVGRKAERRVTITAAMLDQFTALSGDSSAIHVSERAAADAGFPGRVAHGMLLAALVSGLVGTELPGDAGLLQQVKLAFRAPCHPGDEILVSLVVAEFYESVQTLLIDVKISKVGGGTLVTGQVQSCLRV